MAEYIKREDVVKSVIKDNRFVFRTEDLRNEAVVFRTVYKDFADVIYAIPAADVVEVVRCKDCKFVSKDKPFMWCNGNRVNPDDFCSYGERRES